MITSYNLTVLISSFQPKLYPNLENTHLNKKKKNFGERVVRDFSDLMKNLPIHYNN